MSTLASLATPARAATRLDYRGAVLSVAQVEALAQPWLRAPGDSAAAAAALERVVDRLQDLGYLDARARGWRDSLADRVRLEVEEGARLRLASIQVRAATREDSLAVRAVLPLVVGAPVSPRGVNEAIETALAHIADRGHPYAELHIAGWERDSAGVRLVLEVVRGPGVTISGVTITGLKVTRPEFATRPLARMVGQPYQRAAAEAGRERLAQLGLFREVTYEGLAGDADWRSGHLLYRVEEPRFNRFEGALGVQGEAGTVGLARLDLGNLLGTGRALGLHWESRGHGLHDFDARYLEPLVLGTPLQLQGHVAQQVQDTLFTRTKWGGRAGFALSLQERIEIGYEGERVVQSAGEVEQAWLQNTAFALERIALDEPLSPRRGTRARIGATQTFKREGLRPAGTRTARASAIDGRFEIHRPLSAATGATLELQGAARFSSQAVLPLFERYPLGGAATLRGFDEEAFRVDRFALSRLEWRLFIGRGGQRVALFWDHAWMETRLARPDGSTRFEIGNHDGLGFGLRLEAAGGLIGVDYGLEPGRGALDGKIHLQLVSTF